MFALKERPWDSSRTVDRVQRPSPQGHGTKIFLIYRAPDSTLNDRRPISLRLRWYAHRYWRQAVAALGIYSTAFAVWSWAVR